MVSAAEAAEQVDQFKASVKERGERLVKEVFPQRILELNQLLKEPPFNTTDLSHFHSDLRIPVPEVEQPDQQPTAKRRRLSSNSNCAEQQQEQQQLTCSPVPTNQAIADMIETLKPIISRVMDETNLLKMWVTYMIPKIEDGNNFGVSIQEDTLGEISSTESEAATYFYELSRYYSVRAKLVSKVAKYPQIDDYRRAVMETDEKEFISLRLTLIELRNRYATLHDAINKNLEKIKRPRSINTVDSMY